MTIQGFEDQQHGAGGRQPFAYGAPGDISGPRFALYTEEYAADPHRVYREMRRHHRSLVPVEMAPGTPATLVIGYQTALRVLNDPEHFPADPRVWEQSVAPDCPVLPMMGYRPNPIRSTGADHVRYRSATAQALAGVDTHWLHKTVEQVALPLINSFCEDGYCDVISQYVFPLIFAVHNAMLGCPADLSRQAATGLAAMFDLVDAANGNAMMGDALLELTRRKRAEPGADITTRLVQHPVGLSDEEMVHQLALLYGAGIDPPQNLIGNTLLLMLTDDRFASDILGGSLSTRDALDEVLFNDPPMANHCFTYPRQPQLLEGVWLPAHQPVVISMAACNNDPAIRAGDFTDNRSHLAFSAGPHACPARSIVLQMVQDAIDQLLDALPDIELAVPPEEIRWRTGPFHRALISLPVEFPPTPPLPLPF